mmetsp:Transcript_53736/g.64820  ORF Transcript_53736/g.64820 Transcript_53736/m.64820 type:complete len:263 (+) Transcript_53736:2-790(+)
MLTSETPDCTNPTKSKDELSLITAGTVDLTLSDNATTSNIHPFPSRGSMYNSITSASPDPYQKFAVYQRSHAKQVRDAISSMTTNPYNLQLQLASCELLARLSFDEYYRVVISSCGGILSTIITMQNHPDDPEIQAHGCVTLGNLCTTSFDNKAQVLGANGIKVIASAMRNYPSIQIVQSNAFFALKQLTRRPSLSDESNARRAQEIFQATISDDEISSSSSGANTPEVKRKRSISHESSGKSLSEDEKPATSDEVSYEFWC